MLIHEVTESSLAAFVRGEIDAGCAGLSEIISRRIDLTAGRFFLLMPPGFEIPRHSDQATTDGVYHSVAAKHLRSYVSEYA